MSCVAEDLIKMSEKANILPSNHFGCRPGRSSTDTLHYVVAAAKDAWRRGKVLGALFLDIRGAFPSVILERLLHNMRTKGIPKEYMEWIRRKVANRNTTIYLDDYTTPPMLIPWGLDQGCPLSGIVYQFYSTGLIEIPNENNGEGCVSFVDDTTITAEGKDLEDAFKKLENIMTRQKGALDWAKTHDCQFALDKFGLMGFTRRWEQNIAMGTKHS